MSRYGVCVCVCDFAATSQVDAAIGHLDSSAYAVGVTADHGMNDKVW